MLRALVPSILQAVSLAALLGIALTQPAQAATHRNPRAASRATQTLLTEPTDGRNALYTLVDGSHKTIDMTMYELVDTTFSGKLVAACARGVTVRVILDQNLEKANNLPAYTQLNAQPGCTAAWANPAFQATHQKSMIVDGKTLAILTFNLTSRFYPTSRDFGILQTGTADIAAVQKTFNADFQSTTSFSFKPPKGTDLIWSPTTAQATLLGIINGAQKTLLVENEEMGAANIVTALQQRCQAGVTVQIAMTANVNYQSNFNALVAAGCGVHLYANTPTGLYIHAKAMVADFGLPTQKAYVGSINFSIPSMTENRELGLTITEPDIVQKLQTTLAADYAGGTPVSSTTPITASEPSPEAHDPHN